MYVCVLCVHETRVGWEKVLDPLRSKGELKVVVSYHVGLDL